MPAAPSESMDRPNRKTSRMRKHYPLKTKRDLRAAQVSMVETHVADTITEAATNGFSEVLIPTEENGIKWNNQLRDDILRIIRNAGYNIMHVKSALHDATSVIWLCGAGRQLVYR
eukprot:133391_1